MFKRGLLSAAAIAALVSFATSAGAVTYQTPAGSNSAHDGPVSAQANFSLSGNNLVITLTDLLVNPTSAGQLLSGIRFNEASATGSGSLTTVNVGQVTTISAGGAFTAPVADALTRWTATEASKTITLTTLSGGNPDRLIIGPPNGSNLYSAANASIIGDNPNVVSSPTFTITIPGVTSLTNLATDISSVFFIFGTADDPFDLVQGSCIDCTIVIGNNGVTPIPGALPLFASGGGLLGFLGWRRKRKQAGAIAA
jgi:hypothetical protein